MRAPITEAEIEYQGRADYEVWGHGPPWENLSEESREWWRNRAINQSGYVEPLKD